MSESEDVGCEEPVFSCKSLSYAKVGLSRSGLVQSLGEGQCFFTCSPPPSLTATHLVAGFICSPQKDGMPPHPAFFKHWFIVCFNPTQSQKQGVCVYYGLKERERERESGEGGTCYYNFINQTAR